MNYFKDFRKIFYYFGDEWEKPGIEGIPEISYVQDFTQYAEVIDQVREALYFSEKYSILENERPDQVSYKFYRSPDYHWTIYLMNEHIREKGWPLSLKRFNEVVARDYPHQFIGVQADISNVMLQGDVIYGDLSGAKGTILRRNVDLGTMVIDTSKSPIKQFRKGEKIRISLQAPGHSSSNVPSTGYLEVAETSFEYNAPHHYENSNGEYVDIDPTAPRPAIYNEVTYLNRYERLNAEQKDINVIQPEYIRKISSAFKKALNS